MQGTVHHRTDAAAQHNSLISHGSTWKSVDDAGMMQSITILI